MQQQVQSNQPAERCLAEAASFFTRRRAKISDRSERGFRFGLEGAGEGEGGRVSVGPTAGGGTTVTVEADGLGVLAIAEAYVRELRKQARERARDAGRQARGGADVLSMQSGLSALRDRLSGGAGGTGAEAPASPEATEQGAAPGAAPEAAPGEAPPSPHRALAGSGAGAAPGAGVVTGAELPAAGALAGAPPSAEQLGGVPREGEVAADHASGTAVAQNAAGDPDTPPVVDPSVPGQS